jgi:hypothetical protein
VIELSEGANIFKGFLGMLYASCSMKPSSSSIV